MALSFQVPSPLAYFASLVQSDDQFPLLEAAVALAQDEYPDVDLQSVVHELDLMLERLRHRVPSDAPALQRLRVLNQFFFRDLGFAGNVNDYYDPDNSYLNVVVRTRRGIPISLAILWLELAQGIGLHARGVGFPGHFLVKVSLSQGQVVIDPMTGQSLGREELAEQLEPYKLRSGIIHDFEVPLALYLQSEPPREIIARMLRNLKEIYTSHADWTRVIRVQDRMLVLVPDSWADYRDRGLARAEIGQTERAVLDLETYLLQAADAVDAERIAERITSLRSA